MTSVQRLDRDRTAVLIVDMQEKLLPAIFDHEQVLGQVSRLIDGANVLGTAVLVTEQYRKGLGVTVDALTGRLADAVGCWEKLTFSAYTDPVASKLAELDVRSVVVAGIEAHVCVLQSCLDLVEAGYTTAVAIDAIGSRRLADRETSIQRMVQAGVIPITVESALLELAGEAGTAQFKRLLPIIR